MSKFIFILLLQLFGRTLGLYEPTEYVSLLKKPLK